MHPKSPKLLDDVRRSYRFITDDTENQTLDTWLTDRRLRQVVERNLEIIGEALARLRTVDPDVAAQISDLHRIIGLRNRLAHGYDEEIDDALVWQVVRVSVPVLQRTIEPLVSDSAS